MLMRGHSYHTARARSETPGRYGRKPSLTVLQRTLADLVEANVRHFTSLMVQVLVDRSVKAYPKRLVR